MKKLSLQYRSQPAASPPPEQHTGAGDQKTIGPEPGDAPIDPPNEDAIIDEDEDLTDEEDN